MALLVLIGIIAFSIIIIVKPKDVFLSSDIVINEICCHNETVVYSKSGKYVDYVELFNKSDGTINLADYRFSDGKVEYDIPSVDVEAGTYEVIFLEPDVTELQLSDNDVIYLCDRYGNIIDGVNVPVVDIDKAYAKNVISSEWENNCVPTPWEINKYVSEEKKNCWKKNLFHN